MVSRKLIIRDFNEDDIKSIINLHKESAESFERKYMTKSFLKEITQREDFGFFVVSDKEDVIGFIGFLYQTGVGRSEIGPICVKTGYQRKHVGTKLVHYAIECLKKLEIRRAIVKVKHNNTSALSFFECNGFVREGLFERYTVEDEDVIQLRRFI